MKTFKFKISLSLLFFVALSFWQNNLWSQTNKNTKPEKFSEKSYYSQIFGNDDRLKLATIDKELLTGEASMTKINQDKKKSNDLLKKADSPKTSAKDKKKLLKEKSKLDAAIIKEELSVYELFYTQQKSKYTIYNDKIEDAQYAYRGDNIKEGRSYEYEAKSLYKDSETYKRTSEGKDVLSKLKEYQKVDSLQKKAILNFEKAFMVYKDESPNEIESKQKDQVEYERFLAKLDTVYQAEIDALLKGRDPESWMRRIDEAYKRYEESFKNITKENTQIEKYKKEIEELSTKEKSEREMAAIGKQIEFSDRQKKRYEEEALKAEKEVIRLFALQISQAREDNKEKFESYNEGFTGYKREKPNQKIEKAEKEIVNDLTTAKNYLNIAEFSNTSAKMKKKLYTLLLQANLRQAEAMDKLVAIKKEERNAFVEKRIEFKDCNTNLETTGTTSVGGGKIKKTGTGSSNSTGSQSSNSSSNSSGNDNTWKNANKKGIKYKVQLFAQTEVPAKDSFKGLTPISSEKLENTSLTAYLFGNTNSMYIAERLLTTAKKSGYKDAYIVAYNKAGERIALWEAENIISNLKKEENSENYKSNKKEDNTKYKDEIDFQGFGNHTGIVYTIQVAYSNKKPSAQEVKNLEPIYQYKLSNGFAKFSYGLFRDFNSADSECTRIKKLGISDAFVIAFQNGEPIDLQTAIRKEQD